MKRLLLLLLGAVAGCDAGPPMPCTASLPDQIVYVGGTAAIEPCFETKALPLTFQARSSAPEIISVAVTDHIEVTGVGIGEATIMIQATDVNGRFGTQSVHFTVPNRPPEVIPAQHPRAVPLWSMKRVSLYDYFTDPDRQELDFNVSSRDEYLLRGYTVADTLVLHAVRRGTVRLDLRATDPEGESAEQTIAVELTDPMVYVVQATQSRKSDVPLIANRDGLLRVFLVTDSFGVAMPSARATIYDRNERPQESFDLAADASIVPNEVSEGDFHRSLNAIISGEYVQRGARIGIDIGPTIDPAMERRFEMQLDVRELPDLPLTLIPIVVESDSSVVATVRQIAADPGAHWLLQTLRSALPISGYTIRAHDPVVFDRDRFERFDRSGASLVLVHTELIRALEGRGGYYMSIIPRALRGAISGQASYPGWSSIAVASPRTIAHELGHNLNLDHAPCGVIGDRLYPYEQGRIGVWGYDFPNRELMPPTFADLMGYCSPSWISDYFFKKALDYRQSLRARRQVVREKTLVVWGSIGSDGTPTLKPAFHYADGIPSVITGNTHRLAGRDANGEELFSYQFAPRAIADSGEAASFVHLIPATWRGELASIVLTGPTGSARLDLSTDDPLSIVIRDGQVRSITYGPAIPPISRADRVLFSRGIPRG